MSRFSLARASAGGPHPPGSPALRVVSEVLRSQVALRSVCALVTALSLAHPAGARSYYTQRPDDSRAVYLDSKSFRVQGDGVGDDTAALQEAINAVVATTIRGIVFVPEGTYRLSNTIRIWPGVRVIGYGRSRPKFVLADNASGFDKAPAYLFHFVGDIPRRPYNAGFAFTSAQRTAQPIDFTAPVRDANPGTFYSALSNVDIEIGKGNPGAVAVRSTYAQHCFLAHMDIRIGSGFSGIHGAGNFGENLRFSGGKYAIVTRTPSPGWQFTLVDTSFEGQSIAAISSEVAGLTLIRPSFRKMPTAVLMSPERGEQLWIKDGRMEDITGPALAIGNEYNNRNQVNLENLTARHVPLLASFQGSGRQIKAPGDMYRVERFAHGLHVEGSGVTPDQLRVETRADLEPLQSFPAAVASDVAPLPPQETWVNVRTLGVKGDAVTDDTQALRAAIEKHRALYFPMGAYRISETLRLRPDTALIGMHAGAVRIFLEDGTAAFQGIGTPIPMIEAPRGGANIMQGMGIYTNGINPRAVAVKWMSGTNSLMNDVRFLGGHGTAQLSGEPEPIYNTNRTADPDPKRRWDSQYPSLWITAGGGGTFMDIWTPSPYAQSGMLISHTSTSGRIYQMSSEHHVRAEVKLDHVANWELYALQLEEERGESGSALPVEVTDSRNVTLANLFVYRVISSNRPFPQVVKITRSDDIRFRNFHWWTNSRADFNSAVADSANGLDVREREFASLTVNNRAVIAPLTAPTRVLDGKVTRLSDGFSRLSGAAVDPRGRLYAVDTRAQRVWRWTEDHPEPELIADQPLEPVNLATDRAGNLLVVSHAGSVYALQPDDPQKMIQVLRAQPAGKRPGRVAVIPQTFWTNGLEVAHGASPPRPSHFLSPDGSTFIPAGEDFMTGKLSWGTKDHDILRTYGLQPAVAGRPVFISLEWHGKTYTGTVDDAGELRSLRLFADRGGEAVAVDSEENVYIADGHVFVYDRKGALIEIIPVPQRPLGLVFGDRDGRTLYIPAGEALYSVRTRWPGGAMATHE